MILHPQGTALGSVCKPNLGGSETEPLGQLLICRVIGKIPYTKIHLDGYPVSQDLVCSLSPNHSDSLRSDSLTCLTLQPKMLAKWRNPCR